MTGAHSEDQAAQVTMQKARQAKMSRELWEGDHGGCLTDLWAELQVLN